MKLAYIAILAIFLIPLSPVPSQAQDGGIYNDTLAAMAVATCLAKEGIIAAKESASLALKHLLELGYAAKEIGIMAQSDSLKKELVKFVNRPGGCEKLLQSPLK